MLSSPAEVCCRSLASGTISQGMKEAHSESLMPLWLQPGPTLH